MAVQTIQRPVLNSANPVNSTITTGFLHEASNKFYLPVTYDNFSIPGITVAVTAVATQTKLTANVAGGFDNLRVGDSIADIGNTIVLGTPSAETISLLTFRGLNYLVYPHTLNASNLNVQAGDAVSCGTANVIPGGTYVDKIDYPTRRIFLTQNVGTAGTGAQDIIFTPPVRITAVRDSKASANANQIDISVAVSTGSATPRDVLFAGGAREAVSHVIRLEPLNNTTGSKANYAVGVAVLDGKEVKGAASGLNNIDVTALTYTSVGTYNFDADSFLSLARSPRVNPG